MMGVSEDKKDEGDGRKDEVGSQVPPRFTDGRLKCPETVEAENQIRTTM